MKETHEEEELPPVEILRVCAYESKGKESLPHEDLVSHRQLRACGPKVLTPIAPGRVPVIHRLGDDVCMSQVMR